MMLAQKSSGAPNEFSQYAHDSLVCLLLGWQEKTNPIYQRQASIYNRRRINASC